MEFFGVFKRKIGYSNNEVISTYGTDDLYFLFLIYPNHQTTLQVTGAIQQSE
jgi:hypothetical protein